MSKVLAKFRLSNVEDTKWATEGAVSLRFDAVQGEPFGPATPSAFVQMLVQNPAAAAIFKEAYAEYVAKAQAWLDAGRVGEYPKQPEFYVTFKLDDGTGAE